MADWYVFRGDCALSSADSVTTHLIVIRERDDAGADAEDHRRVDLAVRPLAREGLRLPQPRARAGLTGVGRRARGDRVPPRHVRLARRLDLRRRRVGAELELRLVGGAREVEVLGQPDDAACLE